MRKRKFVVLGAALGLLVTSNSALMADVIMDKITTYYFDGPVFDAPGIFIGSQILPFGGTGGPVDPNLPASMDFSESARYSIYLFGNEGPPSEPLGVGAFLSDDSFISASVSSTGSIGVSHKEFQVIEIPGFAMVEILRGARGFVVEEEVAASCGGVNWSCDVGTFSGSFVLLGFPESYSLSPPVPEPSTWAMMLIGFVGIGFMTFHKRRTAALG